ncbi:RNA polymerase subunit sigma-70 [Pseudonocardia endophytica]|uniref:RNA polymerase sigma factor n=1 Tax=Pseudonocardia endophytica TaxID=401976 RepID=A0A4V2PHJ5_PSEEN|nr:RNA polymerase subunit sigma-70 [Pseudonocardia endophytica]TCK20976.1 RNA polymerase sigma-70 factor (ECF subfamily) [Pseudonocardia endophytica]
MGDVMERALAGDGRAFRELTGPYLHELHVHCYRMLGSLTDADDLLQETLVAAWRGLGGFAGRSSLRAWLYRIATNRCLNAIRDERRRPPVEPVPPTPPPEPTRRGDVTWLEPYPDPAPGPDVVHESRAGVELAFVAALQRLPPRQTAAVVLVDVLGFSTAETAGMLGDPPTAVKGLLQRARSTLARDRGTSHDPAEAAERDLAQRFATAFADGDVDGVISLLTDDAWLAMPPAPHEYVGHAAVAEFLRTSFGWWDGRQMELLSTRANGRPAFECRLDGDEAGVLLLTMSGDRIACITRFLGPATLRRFALGSVPVQDAGTSIGARRATTSTGSASA